MEDFFNSGFFWGLLAAIIAGIIGYIGGRPEKTEEKPVQAKRKQIMENILTNGFFWGILCALFAAIVGGYYGNRPEKPKEKA